MFRRDFEAVVDRVLDDLPEWVLDRIDNLICRTPVTGPRAAG